MTRKKSKRTECRRYFCSVPHPIFIFFSISSVSAYFLSKTLVDLPRTFLANLIFSAILYPIVGFRLGAEHFFKFVLVVLLVTLSAESVAYVGETPSEQARYEEMSHVGYGLYLSYSYCPSVIVSSIAKTSQQAGALAPIFVYVLACR